MQTGNCLIAGVCLYVSAASAQLGLITNVGKTVNNMDAIAFSNTGTLYGATSATGSLYTIAPPTGAVTLVHALVGVSNASLTYGIKGLAFQPSTGTLYGATSPDSPNSGNSLVTINPATGQVTVIGPSGTGSPYASIAFAPNGTLYGWLIGSGSPSISAATVNLSTGAGTSLGSPQTPSALPDGGGIAVSSSGVIYVAANGHVGGICSPTQSCTGAFWTINPANGAPTTIGTLTGGPGSAPTITSLAFGPSGILYGIEGGDGGGSWNLITISLSQGGPNAPMITAVENAASNIVAGMPDAGIAQGAIFIVHGSNLGPANISIASSAFQNTTLSNTSVAVTVAGTTVNALMYYTSATQLAALLPSNTPTGLGGITVTYNGETSAPAPLTVIPNNLGIFTIDSSGSGPGIVTYPDYSLVSATKAANCGGPSTTCGAANPGDTLTIWATGLGPVSGSDASGAGLGQNMPAIPLTVWLGGVQAPVVFQGRGCCIGEDQIAFTVPNNVPTGCAVPLVVQIGNEISNNTLMPVAIGSRSCTPTNSAIASVNVEQAVTAGPVTIGNIKLNHYSDGGGKYEDDAKAQFIKGLTYNPGSQPFFVSYVDDQPPGTCLVYNSLNESTNVPFATGGNIDGGSVIMLTGPNGSLSIPANQGGNPFGTAGSFLVPGTFTATGTGGAAVGPFTATVTIPASPTLVSPVNNATVLRSGGMTVTWTGGGSGNVVMEVTGCTDNSCNTGAVAACSAPASTGTFTIPPFVLLALPTGNAGFAFSTQAEAAFTATGLNLGIISVGHYNIAGFGSNWGSGSFTLK